MKVTKLVRGRYGNFEPRKLVIVNKFLIRKKIDN